MNEIKVGEYIRTNKGYIGKILDITNVTGQNRKKYLVKWNISKAYYITSATIVKHSKNIIDLIEIGDYVNGYLVGGISDNGGTAEKEIMIEIPYEKTYNKHTLNEKIKTILTHEQYKQNSYKVGGINE